MVRYGENQQARVIGRIGDNALRERWQDCEIGDAVPEAKMEHGYELHSLTGTEIISKCLPILEPIRPELWFRGSTIPDPSKTNPYEKRTFERVRITVTDDGGYHWHEEYLWKRIE